MRKLLMYYTIYSIITIVKQSDFFINYSPCFILLIIIVLIQQRAGRPTPSRKAITSPVAFLVLVHKNAKNTYCSTKKIEKCVPFAIIKA